MTLLLKYPVCLFLMLSVCCSFSYVSSTPPRNKVVINKLTGAYNPFSYVKSCSVEVRNNKLHFLAIDKNGDMLQIKDIPMQKLGNCILTSSDFRTIYISVKNGTYHDDQDTNPHSMLEIKCADTKPGSLITIGMKTSMVINKKTVRIYATLSGIIPSYKYTEQH